MYDDKMPSSEYLGRHTADIIDTINDHPDWSDEKVASHVNGLRGGHADLQEIRAERERLLGH